MAQFDVYPNPSQSAARGLPFVVVMQSDLLDALATRLTIPLAIPAVAGAAPDKLCPVIVVKGERYRAMAHYAAALSARTLRRAVANVGTAHGSALVAALDVVLSGV